MILKKWTRLLFPLGTPSPQGSRELTSTGKSGRRSGKCPAQPPSADLVQSIPQEPQALPHSLLLGGQLPLRCLWASNSASGRVSKSGAEINARPTLQAAQTQSGPSHSRLSAVPCVSVLNRFHTEEDERKRSFMTRPTKTPNTDHQIIL